MNTESTLTTFTALTEGETVILTDAEGSEEAVEVGEKITPLSYRITEKPKPAIVLNRAQRRALAKYIRNTKKARQMRQAQRASQETRGCPRCGKYFFVPSIFAAMPGVVVPRCQCKAEMRRYSHAS